MNEELSRILEEAKDIWCLNKVRSRDARIQVGRLIHQYVYGRLKEFDHLNEEGRLKRGISREKILKEVCAKLGMGKDRVNAILRTAVAVDLLSESPTQDLGTVSYSTLRRIAVLAIRSTVRNSIRRGGVDSPGQPISDTERWVIKPACDSWAKGFFQEVVRDGWDEKRVREYLFSKIERHRKGAPRRVPEKKIYSLRDIASGSMRDVAESVADLVKHSDDPDALRELIFEQLSLLSRSYSW